MCSEDLELLSVGLNPSVSMSPHVLLRIDVLMLFMS